MWFNDVEKNVVPVLIRVIHTLTAFQISACDCFECKLY